MKIQGKNLIITAHPDDEILFAYSQLAYGDWHVLSMTGNNRKTRNEFVKVMDRLGLTYDIFTHCDDWGARFEMEEVAHEIRSVLSLGFDNVLTHNSKGEYGHTQHQSLYSIVNNLVDKNLFVFGESLSMLSFKDLKNKLDLLSEYKIHGDLGVWEWYDQNDPTNTMMKYVVHEGFRQIK